MLKLIIIFYFFFLNLFASEDYFLTLRNDKVNLRQGPSLDYPIKLQYKKKYLPVLVKDKSGNFRKIVDHQNQNDKNYIPMSNDFKSSIAFKASMDLILEGAVSPSGYTEPILHKRRLELKSMLD